MGMFAAFRGWLTLADYDRESDYATANIVSRFSRGNVSVQNGQILDEKELAALSKQGDHDLARLNRLSRH